MTKVINQIRSMINLSSIFIFVLSLLKKQARHGIHARDEIKRHLDDFVSHIDEPIIEGFSFRFAVVGREYISQRHPYRNAF